jgi:hypothetical protein
MSLNKPTENPVDLEVFKNELGTILSQRQNFPPTGASSDLLFMQATELCIKNYIQFLQENPDKEDDFITAVQEAVGKIFSVPSNQNKSRYVVENLIRKCRSAKQDLDDGVERFDKAKFIEQFGNLCNELIKPVIEAHGHFEEKEIDFDSPTYKKMIEIVHAIPVRDLETALSIATLIFRKYNENEDGEENDPIGVEQLSVRFEIDVNKIFQYTSPS